MGTYFINWISDVDTVMAHIDTASLTLEVRAKLAELDLELSEGDITQKGYDKKRAKLLEPYVKPVRVIPAEPVRQNAQQQKPTKHAKSKQKNSKSGIASSKQFHRDDRFRSDLHSEAVQQALVKHGKGKRIPVVPVGLKRSSLVAHNLHADSDETSDEEMTDVSRGGSLNNSLKKTIDDSSSDVSSTSITPSPQTRPKIDPTSVQLRSTKDMKLKGKFVSPVRVSSDDEVSSSGTFGKNGVSDAESGKHMNTKDSRRPTPLTEKIADIMPQILPGSRPNSQRIPPDVANISPVNSPPSNGPRYRNAKPSDVGYRGVTTGRASTASSEDEDAQAVTKVSAKIQQLLNTLKRPKEATC